MFSYLNKTLRRPRGGVIPTNDKAPARKPNSTVFPGNRG
ncbi:Serine hydroxymethyltransferase [Marinibacterium anthonyi]|nr:Serine hydroxymethyltransferase [Marinibacterium anthonyi]